MALSQFADAPVTPECGGAEILNAIRSFIHRYVAFPSTAALIAVTLWVAHTHLIESAESSPRLALLSPEPGSGKTRTLEVVELLAKHPMSALCASPAAMFRSLAVEPRTLLFDEVDAVFRKRGSDDGAEDLRAAINAGHRRGVTIPRCVGPRHDVVEFPVYAAVALAGLGDLPETLMSRSVIIRMRRRLPTEPVTPFRRRECVDEGTLLRERLAAWCRAIERLVSESRPDMSRSSR